MEDINLYNGDCLEEMDKLIAEGIKVDAIITDPPYGTVKNIGASTNISHGLKNKTCWDDCIDHDLMFEKCNSLLRTNGRLILFSQEPFTSKLITKTHRNLSFSYRLLWLKDHFANSLIAKKAPVNYFEDICVFSKQYDTSNAHPLREYSKKLFAYIGKSKKEIFKTMGSQKVCHFMRSDTMQFGLCTEETYLNLIEYFRINHMDGFLNFKELLKVDQNFSELQCFNLEEGKKYKSNVLQYKKDYQGLHPTQKPVALIEDLIKTYTNEGETVLDFTMGSGTTGVACKNLDRKFIGIELDEKYFNIAKERIKDIDKQPELFKEVS
jgi:site-specific DNA-methyltransferase (adenine-specific)